MYVVLLAIMIHLLAKDYYVAPVYPVLFAAGALAWQNLFSGSRKTAWLLPAWCVSHGHSWRDTLAHGNSCHATVHMDSLHACASPDQREY